MASREDIAHQHELLQINRRNLDHYLKQQTTLGEAFTPPGVRSGIFEARKNIKQIKAILRGWGVKVEDRPNDEEVAADLGEAPPTETDDPGDPTIGIITALPEENVAMKALLDDAQALDVAGQGAGRRYISGVIPAANGRKHRVVLARAGMGNNQAASRAALLLNHFPTVRHIIMVGIAGGVPDPRDAAAHVRLGDIVVSSRKGVVQYDFVKETRDGITPRPAPQPPSALLLEAVEYLEEARMEGQRPWVALIARAIEQLGAEWARPGEETDLLADGAGQPIAHPADAARRAGEPRIFFGPIASANVLLKNPERRDVLREAFGVKAVEMEGSGVADATWNHEIGYLVVRGICDYCDANKNDRWHHYAAIVAAAYARALLESMPT